MVGAGRVGSVLGAALTRAGHRVVAASARSDTSRRRAAELLPGVPLLSPAGVAARSELLLLAVPDTELPRLASTLAAGPGLPTGVLVAHTAGRFGVEVLDPLPERGALPLALHPAMTFSGGPDDLVRLAGCGFAVTAPPALRAVGEALVIEMGGEPVWVSGPDRPLYHAALAAAANHLVTLVAGSAEALGRLGVEDPEAMLGPLLRTALDGALRSGESALTGPVARGDAAAVGAHLDALRARAAELVPSYLALARLTADRALAAGRLTPAAAGALLDALRDERIPGR